MKNLFLLAYLLLFVSCLDNPYDPNNIKRSFTLPIVIQNISKSIDAYPFFPVIISFNPEYPEFIDSIRVYSGNVGNTDSCTLKNNVYKCTFIYSDSGIFKPTARVFIANSNHDRFDTTFFVRIGLDIKPEPVIGFKGDTVKLIVHGTKPKAAYWLWSLANGQLLTKSLKDTTPFVFESMYDSTINLSICDSLGKVTSSVVTTSSISSRFSISITSNSNGTYTPTQPIKVPYGDSISIAIVPDTNYAISQIIYDGQIQQVSNPFKISKIKADHTLNIIFAIKGIFRIVTHKFGQGNISPSTSLIISYGSDTTLHFTPSRNYKLDSIVSNTVNLGNDTTLTLRSIKQDINLSIYFNQIDTVRPIVSNVYPTDSMVISAYKSGYELNKKIQSMEIRWTATPYGSSDSLSPHIFKPDSINRVPGIHVVAPQGDTLVSGGVYDIAFTATDSLGVASILVKVYKVRVQ